MASNFGPSKSALPSPEDRFLDAPMKQ